MSETDPNSAVWLVMIILILLSCVFYWIPTFIAFFRGHVHRWWILLFNLILGCTLIGWFVALIWSFGKIGPKS